MASAPDIVTYIGVPLAVLGVTPILYTCIRVLFTLRGIQHALKKNGLNAVTRGSLVSGVIEVELPRCSITPLEREDPEYWAVNHMPSTLKGGTWTIFRWNKIVTGQRRYRLQYTEDLQEPQAEIDFEELMAFLLDRGAVPDVKGLHMLRLAGLWTPTGTSLLLSPDCTESVLRVSVPDDSDGILSLSLQWRRAWDQRDGASLPPSWMRLEDTRDSSIDEDSKQLPNPAKDEFPLPEKPTDTTTPQDSARSLRFHLSSRYGSFKIATALWEHNHEPTSQHPNVTHLCKPPANLWFPSAAIALGQTKGMALWTCHIPDAIALLATKDCIPCGVLVLLGLVAEKDAPAWATQYDPLEDVHANSARFLAQQRKVNAERMLPAAQQQAARAAREAEQSASFSEDFQRRLRRDRERAERRDTEALNSSRLETVVVAQAALTYLAKEEKARPCSDVQRGAEGILFRMMQDEGLTVGTCKILDRWQQWTDRGGMNKEDLKVLQDSTSHFCNAACLMGLFRIASLKEESSVALDMQECIRVWRKIRLG
ncbi:hypothetical protein MMC24_005676 [Lignoscripta atroalba]|nr:hypothetical protein [Lignoscripta atroalba]